MTELLRIRHVPSAEADARWEEFHPHIERAMAYSRSDADIRKLVATAEMGLFEAVDMENKVQGCLVLQFIDIELSHETVLRIILMAGINLDSMGAYWPVLENLAKQNGAVAIEAFGRPGFTKWAKPLGLNPIYTIYRAEVPHE